MLGVILTGNSRAEIRELPDPQPGPGEALVRVVVSALCGSELYGYRRPEGLVGFIAGHEMVGEVVAQNETRHVRVGDRVAIQVRAGCGSCYHCSRGNPMHCQRTPSLIMGGHAELVAVPEMCCLPLPDSVEYERGVILGGDTIGTTYRMLKRLEVSAFDTVAVLGCGPIGLGMLALLRFVGARVVAADTTRYRRELAARLGAVRVIDPHAEDVVAEVLEATGGAGADIALDCSPSQETLTAALECVRVFGKVGLVGEKGDSVFNPSNQVIRKEMEIVGSIYFSPADYWEIMELYRRGLVVDDVVTHRFPLQEADKAFATFASGESGKVLIVRPVEAGRTTTGSRKVDSRG